MLTPPLDETKIRVKFLQIHISKIEAMYKQYLSKISFY